MDNLSCTVNEVTVFVNNKSIVFFELDKKYSNNNNC